MPKTKSLAFARIKAEVMAATCAIPPGRVTSYSAIAAHLQTGPRQVAFVLSALNMAEAASIPWHRVVASGGQLRSGSATGLRLQKQRLAGEGVPVRRGQVLDFAEVIFRWAEQADRPGGSIRKRYSDPSTSPLFAESLRFGYPETKTEGWK